MNIGKVKIDEKLYQNRYRVDEQSAHIKIRNMKICEACQKKECLYCCPAGCYTMDAGGNIVLTTDGCLECGTCRIICGEHRNIEWQYPRGGYGILFKFG